MLNEWINGSLNERLNERTVCLKSLGQDLIHHGPGDKELTLVMLKLTRALSPSP